MKNILTSVTEKMKAAKIRSARAGQTEETAGEENKENAALAVKRIRFQKPMKSVGMKLLIIFFVSILVFVFAAGFISYEISRTVVENKVSEASIGTITQSGEKIDYIYGVYEDISMQLMLDSELQQQLQQIQKAPGPSAKFLSS